MVKVRVEGEKDKVSEFIGSLKALEFLVTTYSKTGSETICVDMGIGEKPGVMIDEEPGFMGFIAQWIREGLRSSLKDFIYLSSNGVMVSFDNMKEFRRIYEFITENFGSDIDLSQMIEQVTANNQKNFEDSSLLVYGQDDEFNEINAD